MGKKLIYISIIILFSSCNNGSSNKKEQTDLKSETQEFYEFLIDYDSIKNNRLINRPNFWIVNMDSASFCEIAIFDSEDWYYHKANMKELKDFEISSRKKRMINIDKVIPKIKEVKMFDEQWDIVKKEIGTGFYSYSFPYFNKTMDTVIVESRFHCFPLCGSDEQRIFIKKNGKWTFLKRISYTIS